MEVLGSSARLIRFSLAGALDAKRLKFMETAGCGKRLPGKNRFLRNLLPEIPAPTASHHIKDNKRQAPTLYKFFLDSKGPYHYIARSKKCF